MALDTATMETCACLLINGKVHTATLGSDQRMRSTGILPLLNDLLAQADAAWSDIELLAYSHGPGSFTGLRIAAATLAGINAGLHLPVLHLSSLAVTAAQSLHAGEEPLWVLEDARAGEVFAGCYQSGVSIQPDTCYSWDALLEKLPAGHFVCSAPPPLALDGWQQLSLDVPRADALVARVRAALTDKPDLAALPHYPMPAYMQLSQAERNIHVSK